MGGSGTPWWVLVIVAVVTAAASLSGVLIGLRHQRDMAIRADARVLRDVKRERLRTMYRQLLDATWQLRQQVDADLRTRERWTSPDHLTLWTGLLTTETRWNASHIRDVRLALAQETDVDGVLGKLHELDQAVDLFRMRLHPTDDEWSSYSRETERVDAETRDKREVQARQVWFAAQQDDLEALRIAQHVVLDLTEQLEAAIREDLERRSTPL